MSARADVGKKMCIWEKRYLGEEISGKIGAWKKYLKEISDRRDVWKKCLQKVPGRGDVLKKCLDEEVSGRSIW